jgi:predicted secreted hydrolase
MKNMKLLKRLTTIMAILLCAAFPANLAGSQDDGEYLQVTGPCGLSFPADHGPHPGYRTEWWYYTGNLSSADGQRFGFQLTFFRTRIKPPADRKKWPQPASAWRTDQIYMAHAALTDITGGRHFQSEKIARPVLSLAGAEQSGTAWKIYIQSWQAVITPDDHRLQAETDRYALTLDLKPVKPPVLHGETGYSRKGQSAGRASCYYSFTRLQAGGSLTLEGARHTVQGTAWMDHEYSTAPLQPGITGWDWFSLQLSDQTEIMIYLLRQTDGNLNPASGGTYVLPAGQARQLQNGDVRVEPLAYWTRPHSKGRYPVKWKLAIAALNCDLTLTAELDDQEMRTPRSTGVVYWEGSVRAQGTKEGKEVEGVGYVELTGYAAAFEAPM